MIRIATLRADQTQEKGLLWFVMKIEFTYMVGLV